MTVGECIVKADLLRPNAIDEGEKLGWCLELERQLKHEFYPRYVNEERQRDGSSVVPTARTVPAVLPGGEPEGRETVLSGSGPYEEMYVLYVACKIDLASQEVEAYAVDTALFRAAMDDFRKDYHRNHTPK